MLAILVKLIHLIVCIALIVIVLFQADKGEGLSGAFGGGASATLFGERGAETQISKMTTYLAIVFMITSLIIGIWGAKWDEEALNSQVNYSSTPVTTTTQNQVPATTNPLPLSTTSIPSPVTTEARTPVENTPIPTPVSTPVTNPTPAPVAETVPQSTPVNAAPVNVPNTTLPVGIPQELGASEKAPENTPTNPTPIPPSTSIPGVNGL